MMQVYEYFISHHMAKAFESLFSTVTCLPGWCVFFFLRPGIDLTSSTVNSFSMYRLRTLEHKPVLISDAIIAEYGENKVETLHVKVRSLSFLSVRISSSPIDANPQNLLSLGEDRYLTTVILKNFPDYKLKFTRFAKAQTIAPDDFKVLMSQRRRWINSTVHNLFELLFVDRLCGFFCFSMRFIVLVGASPCLSLPQRRSLTRHSCDRPHLYAHRSRHGLLHRLCTLFSSFPFLLSRLIGLCTSQLVYLVVHDGKPLPTFALIMLGVIYGCQVVIYVLHRKFEHIGSSPSSSSSLVSLADLPSPRRMDARLHRHVALLLPHPPALLVLADG
jgi:chitin synthase